MRTFVSAMAVILALLLTAFAVPAAWTDANLVSEDGFVRLTDPLGKDPAFQSRLAAAAVSNLAASLDLPAPAEELGAGLLHEAARTMSSWPEYPRAWNEMVRRSHHLNFTQPSASTESASSGGAESAVGGAAAGSSLVLDLGPMVGLLGDKLRAATGVQLKVPEAAVVGIGGPSQRQVVDRLAVFATMWWPASLGVGFALGLALLAARRRSVVLQCTGIGLAVLAGLWQASSMLAGGVTGGALGESSVGALFARELVAASLAGFGSWIAATAASGGSLFLVGALGLFLRRGNRRAARPAPGSMEE